MRSKRTLIASVPLRDSLVVEESGGSVDDDDTPFDVDGGHDRGDEGHHDGTGVGRDQQQVLRGSGGQAAHRPEDVAARLRGLAQRWELEEVLVVVYAHDARVRRRAYEMLAQAWAT